MLRNYFFFLTIFISYINIASANQTATLDILTNPVDQVFTGETLDLILEVGNISTASGDTQINISTDISTPIENIGTVSDSVWDCSIPTNTKINCLALISDLATPGTSSLTIPITLKDELIGDSMELQSCTSSTCTDKLALDVFTQTDIEITTIVSPPFMLLKGDAARFRITVENNSGNPAQDVEINNSFNLPTGVFLSGTQNYGEWNCNLTGQNLDCLLPEELGESEIKVLIINIDTTTVNTTDFIENIATVSSSTHDSNIANNTDSASTTIYNYSVAPLSQNGAPMEALLSTQYIDESAYYCIWRTTGASKSSERGCNNRTITYENSGDYPVYLYIYDKGTNQVVLQTNTTLTVPPPAKPVARLNIREQHIELGEKVTLDGSESIPEGADLECRYHSNLENTYYRFGGSEWVSCDEIIAMPLTKKGEHTITLTVRDEAGNLDSITGTVAVDKPTIPTAVLEVEPLVQDFHVDQVIMVDASKSYDTYSFIEEDDGEHTPIEPGEIEKYVLTVKRDDSVVSVQDITDNFELKQDIKLEQAGVYQISLTVYDNDDLSHTDSKQLIVKGDRQPIAIITPVTSPNGIIPSTINEFEVTLSGEQSRDPDGQNIEDYIWDTDSCSQESQTYNHARIEVLCPLGEHIITLTVVDQDEQTHSIFQRIQVTSADDENHAPNALFSINPKRYFLPFEHVDILKLSVTGEDSYDVDQDDLFYAWCWGCDGDIGGHPDYTPLSNDPVSEKIFTEAEQQYPIILKVFDGQADDIYIERIDVLKPDFQIEMFSGADNCIPFQASFQVTPYYPELSYSWSSNSLNLPSRNDNNTITVKFDQLVENPSISVDIFDQNEVKVGKVEYSDIEILERDACDTDNIDRLDAPDLRVSVNNNKATAIVYDVGVPDDVRYWYILDNQQRTGQNTFSTDGLEPGKHTIAAYVCYRDSPDECSKPASDSFTIEIEATPPPTPDFEVNVSNNLAIATPRDNIPDNVILWYTWLDKHSTTKNTFSTDNLGAGDHTVALHVCYQEPPYLCSESTMRSFTVAAKIKEPKNNTSSPNNGDNSNNNGGGNDGSNDNDSTTITDGEDIDSNSNAQSGSSQVGPITITVPSSGSDDNTGDRPTTGDPTKPSSCKLKAKMHITPHGNFKALTTPLKITLDATDSTVCNPNDARYAWQILDKSKREILTQEGRYTTAELTDDVIGSLTIILTVEDTTQNSTFNIYDKVEDSSIHIKEKSDLKACFESDPESSLVNVSYDQDTIVKFDASCSVPTNGGITAYQWLKECPNLPTETRSGNEVSFAFKPSVSTFSRTHEECKVTLAITGIDGEIDEENEGFAVGMMKPKAILTPEYLGEDEQVIKLTFDGSGTTSMVDIEKYILDLYPNLTEDCIEPVSRNNPNQTLSNITTENAQEEIYILTSEDIPDELWEEEIGDSPYVYVVPSVGSLCSYQTQLITVDKNGVSSGQPHDYYHNSENGNIIPNNPIYRTNPVYDYGSYLYDSSHPNYNPIYDPYSIEYDRNSHSYDPSHPLYDPLYDPNNSIHNPPINPSGGIGDPNRTDSNSTSLVPSQEPGECRISEEPRISHLTEEVFRDNKPNVGGDLSSQILVGEEGVFRVPELNHPDLDEVEFEWKLEYESGSVIESGDRALGKVSDDGQRLRHTFNRAGKHTFTVTAYMTDKQDNKCDTSDSYSVTVKEAPIFRFELSRYSDDRKASDDELIKLLNIADELPQYYFSNKNGENDTVSTKLVVNWNKVDKSEKGCSYLWVILFPWSPDFYATSIYQNAWNRINDNLSTKEDPIEKALDDVVEPSLLLHQDNAYHPVVYRDQKENKYFKEECNPSGVLEYVLPEIEVNAEGFPGGKIGSSKLIEGQFSYTALITKEMTPREFSSKQRTEGDKAFDEYVLFDDVINTALQDHPLTFEILKNAGDTDDEDDDDDE